MSSRDFWEVLLDAWWCFCAVLAGGLLGWSLGALLMLGALSIKRRIKERVRR